MATAGMNGRIPHKNFINGMHVPGEIALCAVADTFDMPRSATRFFDSTGAKVAILKVNSKTAGDFHEGLAAIAVGGHTSASIKAAQTLHS